VSAFANVSTYPAELLELTVTVSDALVCEPPETGVILIETVPEVVIEITDAIEAFIVVLCEVVAAYPAKGTPTKPAAAVKNNVILFSFCFIFEVFLLLFYKYQA
jgi:hypothetical protein